MAYRNKIALVYLLGFALDLVNMFAVSIAYPQIGQELQASVTQLAWIGNAYMLGLTLIIPLGNGLAQRIGERATLLLSLALFGLGWGGLYTMIQLLAVNAFGLSAAGKILGTITLLDATTAGLGIWIAARIFDVTGSYKPAFQLISVLIILALLAATLVRDERSSQA